MNEPSSKVAFIIVGWNNRDLLKECFDSIFHQTYSNLSVVYVDNNSGDGSAAWVRENYQQVTVLAQDKNTGFAKGNNIGIKMALEGLDVQYIVLLNTDARIAKDWTEKIVDFTKKKPRGALFQGTTFDYYSHDVIDSTHIFLSRNGQGTQGNWRYFYKNEIGPKRVFGVNAAACLITRKFIETQPFKKLFDEKFFMYLEDVDVSLRALNMRWDNYLVPGARAYHMGSASSNKTPGLSLYLTFRNNTALLFKNLSLGLLIKMFPKILRGDIDTFVILKKKYGWKKAFIIVKARIIGLLRLPLYVWAKLVMTLNRKITKAELWSLMRKGY